MELHALTALKERPASVDTGIVALTAKLVGRLTTKIKPLSTVAA